MGGNLAQCNKNFVHKSGLDKQKLAQKMLGVGSLP